ncbi:MAG: cobaltochelatase subunit CobN [Tissierellia bacterium]|jgi:cobaltochelatase CobN|nr:cobaltochelatase subunit CobN [Tissierellia bacterium]
MFRILVLLENSRGYIVKQAEKLIDHNYPNEILIDIMEVKEIDKDKEGIGDFIKKVESYDFIFIGLHGGIGFYKNFNKIIDEFSGKKKMFINSGLEEENLELFKFTGLKQEEYLRIMAYYNKEEKYNFSNMLLYIASSFGEKEYDYSPPKLSVWEGIYHYRDNFNEAKYLEEAKSTNKEVIGVLFHSNSMHTNDIEAVKYIVQSIEKYGAFPLAVFTSSAPDEDVGKLGINWTIDNLLTSDDKPIVDSIINTMGFSQTVLGNPGNGEDIITKSIFEKLGVPVLQAIISYEEYGGWRNSFKGLDNASLYCGVYQPEFDGQLITSIFSCVEKEKTDLGERKVSKPVKERIEKITRLALNWARLRKKQNKDKKVAIIFHNMPPRNDMIGSAYGLDTPRTVYNIVEALENIGVYREYRFKDGEEIINKIIDGVSNDSRWLNSKRVIEKSIDTINSKRYEDWYENLPETIQRKMESDWGKAPGEFMVYDDNMPIPGILNGNIFIGLQPPRGYEEKADEVYHSTEIVPPHQYIAFYKWIKNIFEADVILHIGTHGTLEWLPGKQIALSEECYPDICIDDIPHIYPYIIDIPGEGMQAKRRSYCAIIDHLIPSLVKASSYDYIGELDELIKQYYHSLLADTGKLIYIKKSIIDVTMENNLNLDLKLERQYMEENFEIFLERLHSWIDELKGSLIKDGFHIFGEIPKDDRFDNLVVALLRIQNNEVPSLMESICHGHGLDYEYLKDNPYDVDSQGRTNIMILDELDELSRDIISEFGKREYDENKIEDVLYKSIPQYRGKNFTKLKEVLVFASQVIKNKLDSTTDEMKYLIEGINGRFVPPGGSGCPTRGNVDILPTGRNFYSVDPTKIPSRASYEVGKRLADNLLNRYLEDEGRLPESIAIIVYSGETMKTNGDDISEILYLMGVKPKWLGNTDKVIGFEIIPLEELKRPRIDVTLRITGLFRDTFPNLIEIVEEAVNTVASLDEDLEDNYIKKHVINDIEDLMNKGINFEEAKEESLMRIFGCAPGTYGAGVSILINSKNWDNLEDLGDVYALWGGHAYGKNIHGRKVKRVFQRRLASIDVTVKNESSTEIDMMDSDDYYNYHGGLIAGVRTNSGKKPRSYSGDTSDPLRTKLKDLDEETARIMRSRILNPKWFEGLKKHGYKGAQEIAAVVDIAFGWDATSDVVEDWMYEEISESYIFNDERREWIKSVNPWAVHSIVERLLEANQRDMWNAKDESLQKLRKLYMDIEGNIEEHL